MAVQETKGMTTLVRRHMSSLIEWKMRHLKELFVVLAFVCVGILAFFGYQWYRMYHDKKAQVVFSHAIEAYNTALQNNNPQEWEQTSILFKLGYDQFKNTSFAPYFQSFYADSLLKEGKFEEALAAIELAVSHAPKRSPLAPALQTKQALMLLDSDQVAHKDRGEKLLRDLAYDAKNILADQALFYVGYYCWSVDRLVDARVAWQKLIDDFARKGNTRESSPWVARAQEKMAQLAE